MGVLSDKQHMTTILAIDQYGGQLRLEGKHPRKELLDKLGARYAQKIYVDNKSGQGKHIGYIVYGLWYTLYSLTEWTGKV